MSKLTSQNSSTQFMSYIISIGPFFFKKNLAGEICRKFVSSPEINGRLMADDPDSWSIPAEGTKDSDLEKCDSCEDGDSATGCWSS